MDPPDPAPCRQKAWLRALGRKDLPASIDLCGHRFEKIGPFKHDFFAATGLYGAPAGKVVLKVMRRAPCWGLPMAWLGGLLARHEVRMYRLAQPIRGVPRLLGPWGPTGFVHEYIEGRTLAREDRPDDAFFPRLEAMLAQIHARDAAYVDLEKRENIILGNDGAAYLIDFQISWHLPVNRGGRSSVARLFLRILQEADRYHLLKHWRRHRPDQLTPEQIAKSYRGPLWVSGHRALFRPLIRLRRQVLTWLGARSSSSGRSPG